MQLCLIVDDYLPDSGKIAAKMMHELALEFIRQGHDVLLITPDSYQKYGKSKNHLYDFEGVQVFRFPSGRLKNVPKSLRLVNEFLLSYRAWYYGHKFLSSKKFDFIIYYSPSIFWSYLVEKIRNIGGAKTFLILRDFFPQWVIDNGMIKEKSFLGRFFRHYEFKNYRAADKIGIQSPANLQYFNQMAKRWAHKSCLLYNWSSTENTAPITYKYRKKFGLEGKVIFFYGGNIGQAQDMSILIRLAKRMKQFPEAHFLFIGEGDEVPLVQAAANDLSYGNISYFQSVSQNVFYSILHEVDVGMFSLHKDHKSHNFPGKILGYLSSSKPILGAVNKNNDLIEVINESNSGLVTESGNDDALFENAKKLMDPFFRQKLEKNTKTLIEKLFSVDSAVKTILGNYS
ncbi:glycosyltransferase family 4 protein [Leptospira jelokensis]|uniref:glycosyltransferase family 4 protein n=1 Tax=Leptospira jelokensis TaxID=2484931 RepID=UPI001090E9BD|nr:glycosyltransferase family 4 protein [Leptospira jelokensis]TGL99230.1 glycosyltransferase WbuB [Leptospira jelokensis]